MSEHNHFSRVKPLSIIRPNVRPVSLFDGLRDGDDGSSGDGGDGEPRPKKKKKSKKNKRADRQ